jgi:hypothetical protein
MPGYKSFFKLHNDGAGNGVIVFPRCKCLTGITALANPSPRLGSRTVSIAQENLYEECIRSANYSCCFTRRA